MMHAQICCTAVSNCLGARDKLRHNYGTLNEGAAKLRQQLSLITTGMVFAFLGAIVIGIL